MSEFTNDETARRAFYANLGKKGGEATKRKHGPDYYSRIGKIGKKLRKRVTKSAVQ